MSFFRKDKSENTEPKVNKPESGEEFTDINEAALQNEEQEPANDSGEMEEIYSTRSKQVKYKREAPLEAEAAEKRQAATKQELIKGKLEFSSDAPQSAPEVELTADLDPDTVVSQEIIEDIQDVRALKGIYVQDIDDIDISLDPMDSIREYERRANDTSRSEIRKGEAKEENPYVHRGDKIVSRVPVYRHENREGKVFIKAGRFTEVVEREYDEYLRSADPTISQHYHAMQKEIKPRQSLLYTLSQMAAKRKEEQEQQKPQDVVRENFDEEQPKKPKKKSTPVGRFFRIAGALVADSFVAPQKDSDAEGSDYNSREDEKYVLTKIRSSIKKLSINTAIFAAAFIAALILNILERSGVFNESNAVLYAGISLLILIGIGIAGHRYIFDGLAPLRRLRANSDTAAALAYCGCLLQGITAMFTAPSFTDGSHHLYGYIASMALLLNTVGRLLMEKRVKSNFHFITSHSPAYAAKIYRDEETARRMVSGTTASKGIVAYQHITRFLSDFLKISYAPDPSEEISSKLVPVSMAASVFVTIVYSIIFKSVQGSVSALAVMLCIGVPFTALLAGNLPMLIFSRKMLREDAMVAGYPSVRQFCDTTAVMLNACELYPKGSVRLDKLVPMQEFRVEDNLLMAAAVLKEAMSPIAPALDDITAGNPAGLPGVESLMYEDKSGLVGWIGGERVLVGNMTLMERYHISVPDDRSIRAARAKGREITYVACSGQLIAALILSYNAPKNAKARMQSAERAGLAFVVSSPDPNVTAELIAEQYELFYRSVKVMAPGYANEIDEVTSKVEETSRAYLATRGRQSSLARAVGGCIGLKSNIALGIAVGVFGMVLGILLCATLALYASVGRLSIVEMMIYILFWTAASLLAALIRRT